MKTPNFDFISRRYIGLAFSVVAVIATIALVMVRGLNFGIDFSGGVLIELRTREDADLSAMRESLGKGNFGEISLQNFGDSREVIVRVQAKQGEDQHAVAEQVKKIMAESLGYEPEYRKVDFVGPQVGGELITNSAVALGLALLAMMTYLWIRFEWQYGVGGILALFHDAVATIGFFAITQLEFNLTSVAALLTIIGYSINDSVVIYDRIRENVRRYKAMPLDKLLNLSINETLSRTILTGGTTLLVSAILVIFGGEVIKSFSAAMIFGVVIGTYSSIFISAPILMYMGLKRGNETAVKETTAGVA